VGDLPSSTQVAAVAAHGDRRDILARERLRLLAFEGISAAGFAVVGTTFNCWLAAVVMYIGKDV
jgi:hypothetical protein